MNYLDTVLPEYIATAFVFALFAFKIYKKSISTALIIVTVAFVICFGKYGHQDVAAELLLFSTLVLMVRAILHRGNDTMLRRQDVI